MVSRERCEHKLSAVRHFNVCDVVSRGAGPSGLGPYTIAFTTFKRHAREAGSLIVGIAGFAVVVAFQ